MEGQFPTTHWSRVARAADPRSPEVRVALAELCEAYWYPIYALVRRKGHPADRALDLTQAYFARLIEKGTVAAADPAVGRFRAFLRTDCTFFLADDLDRERALKRGGGVRVFSIDSEDAEGRFRREPGRDRTPERLFERDWALSLIGRAMERLERLYESTGRLGVFRALRPILTGQPDAARFARLAVDLGTTEGALRTAVHRLRERFGDELRAEIAATLEDPSPDAIAGELHDLFAALAG